MKCFVSRKKGRGVEGCVALARSWAIRNPSRFWDKRKLLRNFPPILSTLEHTSSLVVWLPHQWPVHQAGADSCFDFIQAPGLKGFSTSWRLFKKPCPSFKVNLLFYLSKEVARVLLPSFLCPLLLPLPIPSPKITGNIPYTLPLEVKRQQYSNVSKFN